MGARADEWVIASRENTSSIIWGFNMPLTNSRRNTSTPEVLVFLSEVSSNGTTLFTGEHLYLPGNDFICRLQTPVEAK